MTTRFARLAAACVLALAATAGPALAQQQLQRRIPEGGSPGAPSPLGSRIGSSPLQRTNPGAPAPAPQATPAARETRPAADVQLPPVSGGKTSDKQQKAVLDFLKQ